MLLNLKLIRFSKLFIMSVIVSTSSTAETFVFNKSLLWGGDSGLISYQEAAEGIKPAKFQVNKLKDVYLDAVLYKKNLQTQQVQPCLTNSQISSLLITVKQENQGCLFLDDLDKNIVLSFDHNEGVFNLQVPQYLIFKEANDIDPSQWSDGDTAFALNYYTNLFWHNYGDTSNRSLFINSNWKLNLDSGYFLKGDLNLNVNDDKKSLKNSYIYLQKDLKAIRSSLFIGNLYNNAFYFDAYKFNGITLENRKELWAESALRFRPAISGAVSQPSIIEIYQGNTLIKREEVQTGNYNITDYNPIYYGGDINVVVKNLSGAETERYDIPYTPADIFINKNNLLYSFNIGQFEQKNFGRENVYQAGILYGINDYLNLKQGYLYTSRYFAVNYGLLFNTHLGLFQLDINSASAKPVTSTKTFSRYKLGLSYQKNINSRYLSNIVISRYNYSAKNYYSLNQTYDRHNIYNSVKHDSLIQLNGALYGSRLALTLGYKNFWNNQSKKYLSLGVINNYRNIVYNVNAFKTVNDFNLTFGIQIPLGNQYKAGSLYSSYNYSDNFGHSANANYNTQLTESLNAGISVSQLPNRNNSIAGSLNYRGEYFDFNQSIMSSSNAGLSYSGNVIGSLVFIDNNLLALRSLSETAVVVKSEHFQNAKINNTSNYINQYGYGSLSVSPYKKNKISISAKNTSLNVSAPNLIKEIIPVRGSISMVKFETEKSNSVFFEFDKEIIKNVTFASDIYDANDQVIASFSQGNYVFVKNYLGESPVKFFIKDEVCNVDLVKTDESLLDLTIYKASGCINVDK